MSDMMEQVSSASPVLAFNNIEHEFPSLPTLALDKTKQRLPNELLVEIIKHTELKSDLRSWCLVSRAARAFATPHLYREFWTGKAGKSISMRKVVRSLKSFLNFSESDLKKVQSFEARCLSRSNNVKMFDLLEKCFKLVTGLENLVLDCPRLPNLDIIKPILQSDTLTGLTITFPQVESDLGGLRENIMLEKQVSRLKNLHIFKIYNVSIPSWATAGRIATVLRNSPSLLEFGISLQEDTTHWRWTTDLANFFADDPFGLPQDTSIIIYMICEKFCFPRDPGTGQHLPGACPPTLSLRKLYLGPDCRLPLTLGALTNIRCLEKLFLTFRKNESLDLDFKNHYRAFASGTTVDGNKSVPDIVKRAPRLQLINCNWGDIEDRAVPDRMSFLKSTGPRSYTFWT